MGTKYQISQNELIFWLNFIEHQVGFVLPDAQMSWVKGVIERHLNANQMSNTEFLEAVLHDTSLYHQLFDDILIPRTQFFRHLPTFEFIKDYSIQWSSKSQSVHSALTAWSVGCSTGQEAISMLLALTPLFQKRRIFFVYGSDFRQQSLAIANKGEYDSSQLANIPLEYHQYLTINKKHFSLNHQLSQQLAFFSKNLIDYEQEIPLTKLQCQIIVCKNVLIYFRQFEQRDIVNYLSQFLADDGVLLLGAGELIRFQSDKLTRLPYSQLNAFCKVDAPDWLKNFSLI